MSDQPAAGQVEGNPFAQAKRGPGRPPGSTTKKRSHHKKPTVPSNTREVPPKEARGAEIKAEFRNEVYQGTSIVVGLASAAANFGVPAAFGPDSWTVEDRLNELEINRLTFALGNEALTNKMVAEWLAKLGRMATSNAHTALALVCMSIAIPRLQRRGVPIPEEFVNVINAAGLQAQPAGPAPVGPAPAPDRGADFESVAPDIAPVSMAPGGTPDDDGGHGEREVQPGSVPEPSAAVVPDVAEQVRHRVLRRQANQGGGGNVESETSPVGAVTRS